MRINALLDELEQLVDQSRRIWVTDKRLINEERFFILVNDIRASLPKDLELAEDTIRRAETIISNAESEAEKKVVEAREQAERILTEARAAAEKMISENEVTQEAQRRAAEIIEQAKTHGQQIRSGADAYALEVLNKLESMTAKITAAIRTGRAQLAGKP